MVKLKRNKIRDMKVPTTISMEENIPNNHYVRDFYLKDFKYISPDVLRVKNRLFNREINNGEQADKSLLEMWCSEVIKGVRQFFYGGSLHGVKYIFEPTFSNKERATWIIIMLISVAICAVNIIQLFCKWTSTPFVNVIDSLPTPIWAIPFPTVVVCPHLHMKKSYVNVSALNSSEKFFASLVCPRLKGTGLALKDRLKPDEIIELQEFILKGSLQCSDVVKTCNWPAKHDTLWDTRDCCEMFQPVFTNYGLCFAFNSLPLNGMTNETLPWQQWLNPNPSPAGLQWGLDVGYPKVFPPDLVMQPLRVMAAGEANGLSLELYLNSSEHQFACEGNSLGFTILISAPTDHLYTSTVLRIPMDRMTTVEVSPITYKTDPMLRSLAPYKRQCFFQSERRLEYYSFYTDTNCQHDLLIREAKEMCNCVLFNWPRKNILEPICSTDGDFQCINEVNGTYKTNVTLMTFFSGVKALYHHWGVSRMDCFSKVEEQLIYAYYEDCEEQGNAREGTKSCHPSCNDIIYSSQVFYSDLIREQGDGSPNWGKPRQGEVTIVNVHFYEDLFLGQHRHAQYDDYYFAGAIGGLLSLFLGFSIISVAELVYFVILRPFYIIFKEIHPQR